MLDLATAKSKWTATKTSVGSYKLYLKYAGMTGNYVVVSGIDNTGQVADCIEASIDWGDQNPIYTSCSTTNDSNVEDLFKKIDDAIKAGIPTYIQYNSKYGVPESIYLKTGNDAGLADAGDGYSVSVAFEFLTP